MMGLYAGRQRGHLLVHGVWLALFTLSVVVFVLGVRVWFPALQQVCQATALVCQQRLGPTAADVQTLQANGYSLATYAWYNLVSRSLIKLLGLALGGLIFWRRPADRIAFIASLFLVIGLDTSIADTLAAADPAWWLPTRLLFYAGSLCFALFFYLFPSGQFVPRWTRWMALGYALAFFVLAFLPASPLSLNNLSPTFAVPLAFAFFGSFAVAQVYRYRAVSTAVERVQTKWVVFATMLGLLAFLATVVLVVPAGSDVGVGLYWPLPDIGFNLIVIVLPLAIALAILRYRLFDIDLFIRRTLIYSVLSAILALAYLGTVLVLQSLFRALTGEAQGQLVTVLSTLAIAALFVPLRGRVQAWIDRRFYRQKYDAVRILAAFGVSLRDEVELGQLSEHLTAAVQHTMQPAHVGLWLKSPAPRR